MFKESQKKLSLRFAASCACVNEWKDKFELFNIHAKHYVWKKTNYEYKCTSHYQMFTLKKNRKIKYIML